MHSKPPTNYVAKPLPHDTLTLGQCAVHGRLDVPEAGLIVAAAWVRLILLVICSQIERCILFDRASKYAKAFLLLETEKF